MRVALGFQLFSLTIILAACGNEKLARTPQDARGETPIRYIVCGRSGCFVAARFMDMDGCESHRKWADMLCTSDPQQMTCVAPSRVGSAYCSK